MGTPSRVTSAMPAAIRPMEGACGAMGNSRGTQWRARTDKGNLVPAAGFRKGPFRSRPRGHDWCRIQDHRRGEGRMQLGMIGLGRMGANMAARLQADGHAVTAYDRSAEALAAAASEGMATVTSLEALVAKLEAPRTVWLMVPSGDPTETTVTALASLLSRGDVIVDGGNSNYKD